jgi:hypothetical protein
MDGLLSSCYDDYGGGGGGSGGLSCEVVGWVSG